MATNSAYSKTKAVSIGTLLKERLDVPPYQRNYSWKKDHAKVLFQDLYENFIKYNSNKKSSDNDYLLGSMVLIKKHNKFEIIDGQQRLSTITMLLCAIRDIINDDEEASKHSVKIENLIKSNRTGKYLLKLNNLDHKILESIRKYDNSEPSQVDKFSRLDDAKNEKIIINYKFLRLAILWALETGFKLDFSKFKNKKSRKNLNKEEREDMKEDLRKIRIKNVKKVIEFVDYIARCNFVIQLKMNNETIGYRVFETLNSRGMALSNSNLIKSHILHIYHTNSKVHQRNEKWDNLLKRVVKSGQTPDSFLLESYSSRLGDEKSLRSKKQMKKTMNPKNMFDLVKSMVSDHNDCNKYINELEKDSRLAVQLNEPNNVKHLKNEFHAIKIFKATYIRSTIHAAHRRWKGKNRYVEIVKLMTKYFFKHKIISHVHAGKIEKTFQEATELINQGKPYKKVADVFVKADADNRFENHFESFAKEIKKTHYAKYILYTIARADSYDGDLTPENDLTLEHILPQSLNNKYWKEKFKKIHKKYLYNLGNLTLLDKDANSKIKNGPYTEKLLVYRKSELSINKSFRRKYKNWNQKDIIARNKELCDKALKVWKIGR